MNKKIALLLVILVVVVVALVLNSRVIDYTKEVERLDSIIKERVLRGVRATLGKLTYEKFEGPRLRFNKIVKEYGIPEGLLLGNFQKKVEDCLSGTKFSLAKSEYLYDRGKPAKAIFSINYKQCEVYKLILNQIVYVKEKEYAIMLEKRPAKVAIVLDDWGYNTDNLAALFALNRPITLAILPGLSHSKEIASLAHNKNYETILHLPLEPHMNLGQEKGTIYCNMTKKEVLNHFYEAFLTTPYVKGISNHMGSKATEDERLMGLLFGEMKERGLYFLDSLVTKKSVCEDLAQRMKLPFVERSVFLDNEDDPEYISGQLNKLMRQASRSGSAVGIGHARPNTIAALAKTIPQMEGKGIKLVFLSELIK